MKYFTIDELVRSDTAIIKHIDNTPSDDIKNNLIELIENLLDPIREGWTEYCKINQLGSAGIRVNSGYRCKMLNKAVGGSNSSSHMTGFAVDIVPMNGQMRHFQKWIDSFINRLDWDQLIFERPRNGVASWIHIGYKNSNLQQRRQKFTLI